MDGVVCIGMVVAESRRGGTQRRAAWRSGMGPGVIIQFTALSIFTRVRGSQERFFRILTLACIGPHWAGRGCSRLVA